MLHPLTWAKDLLVGGVCSEEELTLYMCGCWSLWTGRNARQHGKPAWSPYAAAHYATKMIEDLLQIHQKPMQVTRTRVSWKKPTPGAVKINADAAFYRERGNGAATGAVVRDEHGELICARAQWYDHLEDVLMASEAVAVRDGGKKVWAGNRAQERPLGLFTFGPKRWLCIHRSNHPTTQIHIIKLPAAAG